MPTKKPTPKKAAPAKKEKEAVKPTAKSTKKAAETPETKTAKASPAAKKAAAPAKTAKASAKKAEPVAESKSAQPAKSVKTAKAGKAAEKDVKSAKSKTTGKAKESKTTKASKTKEEPIKEVKVPKTTVKTSVPYVPGYTPMEKRKETERSSEPLVRYSDNDLNEFRALINKKLESAKKELAYLQGLITRKDDMGGDEADSRYMTMEDGSMSMEREQLSQMASRQLTFIDHLEKSLIRIENKTYGICRVTGRLIEKPRLLAVPHATLSLEAKLGLVKPND